MIKMRGTAMVPRKKALQVKAGAAMRVAVVRSHQVVIVKHLPVYLRSKIKLDLEKNLSAKSLTSPTILVPWAWVSA